MLKESKHGKEVENAEIKNNLLSKIYSGYSLKVIFERQNYLGEVRDL